ncbi:MAG: iron transporter [Myxococcales bacterium]|nr:iron transporter [Myxococcales bacterium]
MQTLDQCALGAAVEVDHVVGDDPLSQRLVALGFWPDARIMVEQCAPLGDPTLYSLHGYRLALRRDEAVRVVVRAVVG